MRICTASNESNTESISGTTLAWTFLKKPYLHGKIIVIDNKKIWLGSQNLTKNSLENNREVGIILTTAPEIIGRISALFEKDCIFR